MGLRRQLARRSLVVLFLAGGCGGDNEDDLEGLRSECAFEGFAPLVRTEAAPDGDARGRLTHCSRPNGTTLRIRGTRMNPGIEIDVLKEDAEGSLEVIFTHATSQDGTFEARLNDKALGVTFIQGTALLLAPRAGGDPILEGTIPPVFQGGPLLDGEAGLDNRDLAFAPLGKARVQIELQQFQGWSTFELDVAGMPPGVVIDVFLADPDSGALVKIASLILDPSGRASLAFETMEGEALPFRVPFANELFGLEVELRSTAGSTLFSGRVPSPTQ